MQKFINLGRGGFDPLPTQRVPLYIILRYLFLVTYPKTFSKGAFEAKIYTTIFQKKPINVFFGLFFQNFACGAENLAKTGSFWCFGRARKINLVGLKKRSTKLSNFFLKIRPSPLLEKILDPPLNLGILFEKGCPKEVVNIFRSSCLKNCLFKFMKLG